MLQQQGPQLPIRMRSPDEEKNDERKSSKSTSQDWKIDVFSYLYEDIRSTVWPFVRKAGF